jgi:hypothetical protein
MCPSGPRPTHLRGGAAPSDGQVQRIIEQAAVRLIQRLERHGGVAAADRDGPKLLYTGNFHRSRKRLRRYVVARSDHAVRQMQFIFSNSATRSSSGPTLPCTSPKWWQTPASFIRWK